MPCTTEPAATGRQAWGCIPKRWKGTQRALAILPIATSGTTTDKGNTVPASCVTPLHRGDDHGARAVGEGSGLDGFVLAGGELFVGRPNLSLRQPATEETACQGTRQTTSPGPLGDHTGLELHLRSPEPGHQEA